MILFEKVKALCQTIPEYKDIVASARQKRRARDIYDICRVFDSQKLNLEKDLLVDIFKAKRVPLELIGNLESLREYNRDNWETVIATIPEEDRSTLKPYDYYFDKVLEIMKPFTNP